MAEAINFLLEGPSWVQYLALVELEGKPESGPEPASARQAIFKDERIKGLISELIGWPGPPLQRHNDASHLLHKLVFYADLGMKVTDPGVGAITERILENQSFEGAFQVLAKVSPSYGGTGQEQRAWMLCDAPSILYALLKMGLQSNNRVQAAVRHLASLSSENGWPCAVSKEIGKFRGPGRKTDPCPYATLLALKALSQLPEWRDSQACRKGAEALLNLWEQRKERRPYLFAMGTDFCKLKAPFIWYDILHVLEVLTQFPWLHQDKRLLEMLEIVIGKADAEGRHTAESIWKAWSDWEFGQKKVPSRLITFYVRRILKRMK